MIHGDHDDIDQLIGGDVPDEKIRGPGRRPGSDRLKSALITSYDGDDTDGESGVTLDLADVTAGVTVSWLSAVFGMAPMTVKKKLAHCPPLKRLRNARLYNLRQAAAYLLEPKVDIEQYLKNLRPEELPVRLQKDYWEALLKRQNWELRSGKLWVTEDVLSVFGEAFTRIKTATQLWVGDLERRHGLTDAQRETLTKSTDRLLEDLYAQLVSMPKERRTPSLRERTEDAIDGSATPDLDHDPEVDDLV